MSTQHDPADTEAIADVRALLHPVDPAPNDPLSEDEVSRGAQLLQRITRDFEEVDPRRQLWPAEKLGLARKTSRGRSKRVTVLVAASAAALLAVAWFVALQSDGKPAFATPALPAPLDFSHGTHQAAVALLQQAAALQGAESSAPGSEIVYSKTQNYALSADVASSQHTTTYVLTTVQQVWVAPSCMAMAESQTQEIKAATGEDVGAPGTATTETNWTDTNCGLPTSSPALDSALAGPGASADNQDERTYDLANGVMTQLGLGTAKPALVSALYGVLAGLPGIFYAGTVRADDGQVGQAIGVQSGTVNSSQLPASDNSPPPPGCANPISGEAWDYFVVDRTTGNTLEVEEVDSTPPCALRLPPRPTVGQYNVVLASGNVVHLGDVLH